MWLKYRNLYEIIVKYANSNGTDETSKDIVDVLTKNRSVLLSVLKNLGRSSSHRAQLDNIGGSVKLESGQSVKVDQALRSESIIISDLFNCDELDALELVLSGELQLQNFGFLTRGLCAIICYYDAHRFLSASVKALIEMKISEDIQKSKELDAFLEQFCSDPQLPRRLIEVLRTVNTQTEFQNLHQPQVNGLGGPKHQRMLREMIDETLSNCTSALFSLCSSWRKDFVPPFMRDLFAPLKAIQPSVVFQNSHLSLWTALLILISPHNIQHLRCAKEILEAFCKEVFSSEWSDQCVAASLQLACVVTFNWLNVHQAVHEVLGDFSLSEDEFLERAIGSLCFVFIRKCIITSPGFRSNVVFFDVVDALLKNFIAHFPSKLVLLQRVCEEELLYTEELLAKGELYWPKCHFEAFLHCIGDLYDDESERTILLSSQFTSVTSEELVKFIKNGRNLYAPVLHVAFLDMAKNLCKTRDNAEFFYQLVSSFPSVKGSDERTLNIHHFWKALREYLLLFQRRRTSVSNVLRPFTAHPDSSHLQINQSELAGLIAWVQFCERIAIHDPNARLHFVENSLWACTETVVGLLVCSVPLVLKGSLYRFLAAVAKDEQSAVHIWSSLSANGVLSQSPNGKLTGIQEELDDRECSLKRYDSSLGFLALMKELLLHLSSSSDALHLQLYLQFISKSIICQFGNRSYENVQQMASFLPLF
ncbi:hypothetical protein AB6A40_006214 [Gnathostoma spinigerum]|uniref:Uncharacterized protein n=1 Tax=Gnathostoma spinigerum TaxID=75299 RepID=A0ABD6EHP7_9BILA